MIPRPLSSLARQTLSYATKHLAPEAESEPGHRNARRRASIAAMTPGGSSMAPMAYGVCWNPSQDRVNENNTARPAELKSSACQLAKYQSTLAIRGSKADKGSSMLDSGRPR